MVNNYPTPAPKRRKGKKKLLVVIAAVLILAVLVQTLVYPFMLQKATGGIISTLAISKIEPGKAADGEVSERESKAVSRYAAGIKNAYAWQLAGTEKSFFNRLMEKLDTAAPIIDDSSSGLGDFGFVLKAYAENENASTKQEVASDIANIAAILEVYGYDKLSLALLGAAAEENPLDPVIVNNMACGIRGKGNLQDAYKLLSYAYKMDPTNMDVLINLGNTSLDMEDLEYANHWFRTVLDLDNDYGPAHEGLMLCYIAEKNYAVAMRHMIKAAKDCFTPATKRVYETISHLDNYEDIRDQVLKGFTMDDIAKTYQRKRDGQAMEGIDTPGQQLKIPQFPTYANAEKFISNIGSIHEFAMSILNPAMDQLKEIGEMVKQAEQILQGLQSGGLGGLKDAAEAMGLGGKDKDEGEKGNGLTLPVSSEREAFTISLMGDYLDMKVDEYMEEMYEKIGDSENDPIMDMLARSEREIESRGESEQAWLSAMANNWGNSFAMNNDTIKANKVSLNQHIDAFYRAVIPAYNGVKPELEEYWLRTGGVLKYAGEENAFKALALERRIKVSGTLANFAFLAEIEAINVPLAYAGFAVGGNAQPQPPEPPEKLDMPKDEQKGPEQFISIGLDNLISIEFTDEEIEFEFNLLIAGGIKHNMKQGSTTLSIGGGLGTGKLAPGVTGAASECYYWTFKGGSMTDHGYISKYSHGVNAALGQFGNSYTEKRITKVSNVTHAVERTIEKAVAAELGAGSVGFKTSRNRPLDND